MEIPQFDRDVALDELLAATPTLKLRAALAALLGEHWEVVDAEGRQLLGAGLEHGVDTQSRPLMLELEAIGRLSAGGVKADQLDAAAAWLSIVLVGACRYRMASDLHLEAVHADYQALQREHQALQESEMRYRELAAQLEQRVQEQVQTISRAERQLYQAEKMASVGSLAAGMAHEINNPIGFIRSNTVSALGYVQQLTTVLQAYKAGDAAAGDSLWRKADLDFVLEDFPGLLQESVNGADRVARIVANLKTYANIDYAESAQVDLNDAVRTVGGIVSDQLPQGVQLSLDLQALPKIECDQGRINQMLLSILQNAVLAISGAGQVAVSTRALGGEIRISISDTGCGMPPEVLQRIFDPFYTRRDVGKGTGLGLTVSADVAATHGGRIEAESTVGRGSTFHIFLPLQRPAQNVAEGERR